MVKDMVVDMEVVTEAAALTVAETDKSTKLLFAKLSEHASAPTKGSKLAAGFDLMSAYDSVIPKRGSGLVKTDIQVQLPSGTYGRVAPRSGLALKNRIDVGAGVIDEDYRGNIGVILFNHGDQEFKVTKGDRIAQLICEKLAYPEVLEVETLELTERGVQGFGSTGVKKLKLDLVVEPVDVEEAKTKGDKEDSKPKENQAEVKEDQAKVKEDEVEMKDDQAEVKEDEVEMKDDQAEVKEDQVEVKEDQVEVKEDQVEVKEDQVEVKEDQAEVKEAMA